MWYSANCDIYLFYCNGGNSHFQKGWKSCTYSFKNMIRKEELDWNQSYLARESKQINNIKKNIDFFCIDAYVY